MLSSRQTFYIPNVEKKLERKEEECDYEMAFRVLCDCTSKAKQNKTMLKHLTHFYLLTLYVVVYCCSFHFFFSTKKSL